MNMSTLLKPTVLSIGLMSAIGCTTMQTAPKDMSNSATVYYNGNIITMEGDQPQMAEALVTQAGKIAYVGNLQEAQSKYKNAAQINLQDKTLLPSFIDPHSHFDMVSNTMGQVNLNPPPIGQVDSIPKMMQTLKEYKVDNNIANGDWIFGWGYDETQLAEGRHPTKSEIDKVLPNNPVYLQHTSGHMGVANSKALAMMNITADSKNPAGGNIARIKGSNEPKLVSCKKRRCIRSCAIC